MLTSVSVILRRASEMLTSVSVTLHEYLWETPECL